MQTFLNQVSETSEAIYWRCLVEHNDESRSRWIFKDTALQHPLLRQCAQCSYYRPLQILLELIPRLKKWHSSDWAAWYISLLQMVIFPIFSKGNDRSKLICASVIWSQSLPSNRVCVTYICFHNDCPCHLYNPNTLIFISTDLQYFCFVTSSSFSHNSSFK